MRTPRRGTRRRGAVWLLAFPGTVAFFLGTVAGAAREEEKESSPPPPPAVAKPEVPADYKGAALPLESSELDGRLRRAEEHFQVQEWARGLAVLDEVLAGVTAPPGRKKTSTAKKAKEKEKTDPAAGRARIVGIGRRLPLVDALDEDLEAGGEAEADAEPRDAVFSAEGIRFVPVAAAVRRKILELPAEARDIYRRTYEAPAREALEKARGLAPDKIPAALRRVAERYPVTPQGADAWKALGDRLLGAGRPAEAIRALETRLELPFDPADPVARATVLAQAATAAYLAGASASANRFLDEIARRHSESMIALRGQAVAGRDLKETPSFREMARRAAESAARAAGWRTASGTFDHAALPLAAEALPPIGSQARWIYPLIEGAPGKAGGRPIPALPGGHGASFGGSAFVRQGGDIVAIDAPTGKILWRASPGELDGGGEARQAAFQPLEVHGTRAADAALTVFEVGRGGASPLVVGVHRSLHGGQTETGKMVLQPNLLAAYSAKTGKLAWAFGDSRDEKDPARGLAFTAQPVAASGLLVAPAVRGEGVYAAAVTPAGKSAWVRRLYAYGAANQQRYGAAVFHGTPFAASEGIVAASCGHGLISALDAATGEILWTSRYRSQVRQAYWSPHWVPGPPIISGGAVVAAPPDSDYLTVFDLRSGAILWERQFPSAGPMTILGADRERVYLGLEKVLALRLENGKDAWESEAIDLTARARKDAGASSAPSMPFASGSGYSPASLTSAVVVEDRLLAAHRDGTLALIDARDGKILSSVRVSDPRIPPSEPMNLFLAGGEVLAVTANRLFALEPQAASWGAAGETEGKNLSQRSRLLRSEGRYAEALRVLETLRSSLKARPLIEDVEADIVLTSKMAAEAMGQATFVTALLARKAPLVKERAEVLALRLLEAKLLETEERGEGAVAAYLKLAGLDGVIARSSEGADVDVGAYACDALRELKAKGLPVEDPRGEERARERLAAAARPREQEMDSSREAYPSAALRAESFLVLRRAHLAGVAEIEKRLSQRAEEDGDAPAALELQQLLGDDHPAIRARPETAASLEKLAARIPHEAAAPGLVDVLDSVRRAGAGKLAQLFWSPIEEGFLASGAPGSAPLPALVALSGTKIRVYDNAGRTILERSLPGYPDVSDVKLALQAQVEEPALVHLKGGNLALFTAAGLYAFRGLREGASAAQVRPGDFKVAWVRASTHPLLDLGDGRYSGWWGGIPVPQGQNFFPEATFEGGAPIVLLRNGSLYEVDPGTGKLLWRLTGEVGAPASPPVRRGPWVLVSSNSPAAIHLLRAGGGGRRRSANGTRSIQGPATGVTGAALGAGGLAGIFAGEAVEAIEAASQRTLWRRPGDPSQIAFVTASEVWLSEPSGRLVARSLRSGRVRRTLAVPPGTAVVEAFSEGLGPAGTLEGWTLVLSRSGGRASSRGYQAGSQTGTDLHLIRVSPTGEKLWETQVHRGAVTFGGGRYLASDGRYVLLFNAEAGEEKWYTRLVAIEPKNGSLLDLLSIEVHGKGTGQPPRLQVLVEGLGVGNSDGYGWFAPRGPAKEAGGQGQGGPGPPPVEGRNENRGGEKR